MQAPRARGVNPRGNCLHGRCKVYEYDGCETPPTHTFRLHTLPYVFSLKKLEDVRNQLPSLSVCRGHWSPHIFLCIFDSCCDFLVDRTFSSLDVMIASAGQLRRRSIVIVPELFVLSMSSLRQLALVRICCVILLE